MGEIVLGLTIGILQTIIHNDIDRDLFCSDEKQQAFLNSNRRIPYRYNLPVPAAARKSNNVLYKIGSAVVTGECVLCGLSAFPYSVSDRIS